jgi:hypothetical protein
MTACADVAQAILKELTGSMPSAWEQQREDLLAAERRRDPTLRRTACSVCHEAGVSPPARRKDLLPAKDQQ